MDPKKGRPQPTDQIPQKDKAGKKIWQEETEGNGNAQREYCRHRRAKQQVLKTAINTSPARMGRPACLSDSGIIATANHSSRPMTSNNPIRKRTAGVDVKNIPANSSGPCQSSLRQALRQMSPRPDMKQQNEAQNHKKHSLFFRMVSANFIHIILHTRPFNQVQSSPFDLFQ